MKRSQTIGRRRSCPAVRILAADLRADQLSEAAERAPLGRKIEMRLLAKQARTHAINVWLKARKAAA